ncbi:hypothetical protein [Actinokineospora sp.]|uniref:hypothetical protein n=1 Tax=Actinokineospora sp. TaxID=1872133 RepID=UPI003D6BC62D
MWRDRFVEHVRTLLSECGHPDIASVDTYQVDGSVSDLQITCTDGRVIKLNIVRTSPPSGDNYSQPEPIVVKGPATQ